MKKSSKKKSNNTMRNVLVIATAVLAAIGGAIGVKLAVDVQPSDTGTSVRIEFSTEQVPAVIDDGKGEYVTEGDIPTVEIVDGGQFKDKDTGVSMVEGQYADLGWSEWYDTSSPEAFRNATLGRCVIANNYYGAQCVSLARVYWWSYADRDVSTCGTGMAKGMMNCADVNAGDDFVVMWSDQVNNIQAGDWLVFNGGQFGHVGMALGPVSNGYVALLGENQGGHSCGAGVGGSATNIINKSVADYIGGYRPKDYIAPEPEPEPTPEPVVDVCSTRVVKWGDTMGQIMLECTGEIKWGADMDAYAQTWYSKATGESVFFGWTHGTGYGLLAGDTITKK